MQVRNNTAITFYSIYCLVQDKIISKLKWTVLNWEIKIHVRLKFYATTGNSITPIRYII